MNLINLVQSQLSPQTIGQIANTLGEGPAQTRSALGTAIPAVIGTVVGKATSSSVGANEVFNLIKQNQGGWSDSTSNWLSGANSGGSVSANSLLSSLLGSKLTSVADFVASHTGIKGSSAGAILGMAAPLVIGTLGKHISSQGLGASGLAQLLGAQIPYLKEALPPGLAQVTGIDGILSGGVDTSKFETPLGRAAEQEATYQQKYGQVGEREGIPAGQPRKGSALKWAVPLVLFALGAWFLFNRSSRERDVGGTADYSRREAGTERSPQAQNPMTSASGIGDDLARAAANGDYTHTFALQGLSFDNTGNLAAAGRSKIQEIGATMTASPSLRIRITAFAPSEQDALSRANAIKATLMSTGISEDRIQTHGAVGGGAPEVNVVQ